MALKRYAFIKSLIIIALGGVILTGCSKNIARFSVATTGNLPLQNVEKGETVKGKDCRTYIFGFPLGNTQNRVSGAVGKALDQASKKGRPSDALVNVDIRSTWWTILIFGRSCLVASGQPITVGANQQQTNTTQPAVAPAGSSTIIINNK